MKIGIVGSRRRNSEKDFEIVKETFLKIKADGDSIVSGGCPMGADRFAEIIARYHGIPIKIYIAKWIEYGTKAGFIRNTDIAMESDILIACVANDRKGGTEDTIKKFVKFHPEGRLILV